MHWLRQGDKESGEEFLTRAYQQAAAEGAPGLACSASGSLGIRRIVVVRPGHATVLVGKGERIVWLKLESRHYEVLRSRQGSC